MTFLRHETIRKYIEEKNIATIKEINSLFPDVSLMTIHRDLNVLEQQGIITKHRGMVKFAKYKDDVDFHIRINENNEGKLSMVKKAITLINPSSSVFLDAGTSNLLLAKNLPDIYLNVVTTSPGIALELCQLNKPEVTLCGGAMNKKNMAVSGQNTLEMLHKINIDLAVIGVSGYSASAGFTCGSEADMLIKKMLIEKARIKIMMCGVEKLERLMPHTFANIKDIDYIITDGELPDYFMEEARRENTIIL